MHMHNIYEKLDVNGRVELTNYAREPFGELHRATSRRRRPRLDQLRRARLEAPGERFESEGQPKGLLDRLARLLGRHRGVHALGHAAAIVGARLPILGALLPLDEGQPGNAPAGIRVLVIRLAARDRALPRRHAAAGDREVQTAARAAHVVRAGDAVLGAALALGDRRRDTAVRVGRLIAGPAGPKDAFAEVAARVLRRVPADAAHARVRGALDRIRRAARPVGLGRRRAGTGRRIAPGRLVALVGHGADDRLAATHAGGTRVGLRAPEVVVARLRVARMDALAGPVADLVRAAVRVGRAPVAACNEAVVSALVALVGALGAPGARIADVRTAAPCAALVRPVAVETVVTGRAVGRRRIRAETGLRIARPREVAIVESGAHDRARADTAPPEAGVGPRAGVGVVAWGAVGLERVGAAPRRRIARAHVVTLVERAAHHRAAASAHAVHTSVDLGAGVGVVAGRPLRPQRVRARA
ncbi:MAG: hypothetical protein L0271_23080, partial [Gemmatimonadetes bacterium]|nr:hypothetical protein [Gemmatimonadota bacterium]